MGFTILVSDVDTVWMQNPLPYMANYMEADVLTSSDHLVGYPTPYTSHPYNLSGVLNVSIFSRVMSQDIGWCP